MIKGMNDLLNECLIQSWDQVSDCLFLVATALPWHRIAKRLSQINQRGVFIVGNNVTWVNGPLRVWICNKEDCLDIMNARSIAYEIMEQDPKGNSVASVARELLKWTGIVHHYRRDCERLFECGWHYFHCIPGLYSDSFHYDVSSCYYTIISRLPSPLICVDKRECRVIFLKLETEQRRRWNLLIDKIAPYKKLRNSLSGCMSGGARRRLLRNKDGSERDKRADLMRCYSKGIEKFFMPELGPLPAAAALTVRTEWELCALAVRETEAVYAVTDSVITHRNSFPETWISAGFRVREESRGEADILRLGTYRVGSKQTKNYTTSMQWAMETGREPKRLIERGPPVPEVLWGSWLKETMR